jgi:hypothetical protein
MSADEHEEPRFPEAMWDLLRHGDPDPRAVQAAYLRFVARRRAVGPFVLLRWLLAGFAAGWGVAFAATGDPLFGAGRLLTTPVEAPVPEANSSAPARPSRGPAPAASSVPTPGEQVMPAPEPSGTDARAAKPSLHGVLTEQFATDPKWQRAASALKARDYDASESALRELELAGTPADREAASLAVAQVLLTKGRLVEARARLERLRASAASALVREKAAALLTDPISTAERSPPAPAVPQ